MPPPAAGAGAFIALEGGEGAGKGTVLAVLARRLELDGHAVLPTREPGGTPEGVALRGLLLSSRAGEWDAWAELLLMTAARVQHVRRVIEPAVAAGRLVLCDRFVGSTIAYQGAGRGLPTSAIARLHRNAVGGILPDLTILLDVDPVAGLHRSRLRLSAEQLDEGRFEELDIGFHRRVRQSFLDQASDMPDRHAVIDAGQPAAAVADAACAAVRGWLQARIGQGRP